MFIRLIQGIEILKIITLKFNPETAHLKKIENFFHKSLISGILPDLSDYKFITVIRHPLKRLVSAYSDKIGRGSTRVSRQYYWHSYGREIISRYRKNYPNLTQGQCLKIK